MRNYSLLIMLTNLASQCFVNKTWLRAPLLCDYKNFIISIGNRLPKMIILKILKKIIKKKKKTPCISLSISLSIVKMNIWLLFLFQ